MQPWLMILCLTDILKLSVLPWSSKKVMVFDFTFAVSVFTEAKRMWWITEFRVLAVSVFTEAETTWRMPGLLSIYSDRKWECRALTLCSAAVLPVDNAELFIQRDCLRDLLRKAEKKMQNTKKRFKSRLPGMKTIDQWTQTGLWYSSEVTIISFSDRSLSFSLFLSLPFLLLYCLWLLSIHELETLNCWIIFSQNRGKNTRSKHCSHTRFKNLLNQTLKE